MALTIYYPTFHPAYLLDLVRKGLETERFSQRKKWTTSGGYPQFPKRFSGKFAFLFDLKPKFPDFLAKW